ncbi:MAG TPA: sialidase family protein [Hanamia sp.]|nr:sialidase family protein [Hanamia sp.]
MKKLSTILLGFCSISFFFSCKQKNSNTFAVKEFVVAEGQMPSLVRAGDDGVDLVYGKGDSILYTHSNDGKAFSDPVLVDVLPGLYSFATRGPQIAETDSGPVITACTQEGNIFSYYKKGSNWFKGALVNDTAGIAKEGLMDLSADGKKVFAVWLDLRGNQRNKIVGARSEDGGKTWLPNKILYVSPDSVVCACCKPSVAVHGKEVDVMFRNWLGGNRDLYLLHSTDGGVSFSPAQKLGEGSWILNACPMDGGGLAINENGKVQTVWRRKDSIYADVPGEKEKLLGAGKNCTVANVRDQFYFAWSDSSKIRLLTPDGKKLSLGEGMLPVMTSINEHEILCAWEDEQQIHAALIHL